MKRASSRTMRSPAVVVASLLLAAAGTLPPVQAQYYYQPAPGYYRNDTAAGTFMGGALGAVTGAIVGGKDNRGEGALVGAGVGALTGNLLGRSQDRFDEQRAATGAATVNQWNAQAAAQAVTNYDVLEMTRAGISEDVIVSTMRSRGSRVDLSPSSVIALKQAGVSDRVVLAAQDMAAGPAPTFGPPPTIVTPVPPVTRVYVADPWPCHGPYYHHYHGHHWHGHHHGHGHIHFGF